MLSAERRNGDRHLLDMPVTRQYGDDESESHTLDVSPSGVKIKRHGASDGCGTLCNLELHIVPGAITTVIAARRVWRDEDNEAYEFISPSFSQQMMIERLAGNL